MTESANANKIDAGDADASGRDLLARTTGLLDELRQRVVTARAVPMSASVMVNKEETLAKVDELRALVAQAFGQARTVLARSDELVEIGRAQAAEIIATAQAEAAELVAAEAVHRQAESAATEVVKGASREAGAARAEIDDYVDRKLAHFEVVLSRTLAQLSDGRRQLADPANGGGAGDNMEALRALSGHADDVEAIAPSGGHARERT
jgi:hypothetical protein